MTNKTSVYPSQFKSRKSKIKESEEMSEEKKELTPKQVLMESYAACLKTSKNSSLRTYDLVEKNENDFFNEIVAEGYDPKEVYDTLLESGKLTNEEVGKVSIAYANIKKKICESSEELDEETQFLNFVVENFGEDALEQLDEIDHSLPREERLKILAQKVDRHIANQYSRGRKISQRGYREYNRITKPLSDKYADSWEEPRGSGKTVGYLINKDGEKDTESVVPFTDAEEKIQKDAAKHLDKYNKLSRPLTWSGTRWTGARDQLNPENHQYKPGDFINEPKNWPKHDDRVGGMHKYLGANRGSPRGDHYYSDGRKYDPKTGTMEKVPSKGILNRIKYYLGKN
jgi:hypothetical protein